MTDHEWDREARQRALRVEINARRMLLGKDIRHIPRERILTDKDVDREVEKP